MPALTPARIHLGPCLAGLLWLAGCGERDGGQSGGANDSPPPAQDPAAVAGIGTLKSGAGDDWATLDDPATDGWDTEMIAAEAKSQLKVLSKVLTGEKPLDSDSLETLATPATRSSELVPPRLQTIFQDRVFHVQRGAAKKDVTHSLPAALDLLLASFGDATGRRSFFKIIHIEKSDPTSATTRQLVEMSGHFAEHILEHHALWEIEWSLGDADQPPRMNAIKLLDFEQVAFASKAPLFSDCTESVLGENESYRRQLLFGYNYWLERLQDTRKMALLGTPGLALGDVNGDGLDDLYLCQPGGLPNRLYLQQPDGTLRDATEESATGWLESSRSALLVDLDNDGDQDLAVATYARLVIAENDGAARFRVATILETGTDTMSLSAADPDLDGDLDLYLCNYSPSDLDVEAGATVIGASGSFRYHDANNGGSNQLFRNDLSARTDGEDWKFTDITEESGLDTNNRRFSFAASWEDYDNDGDQDLYVANDFGFNNLYRNDSEAGAALRFVDVAADLNGQDQASGMSVSWGDVNRDGRMDLYIGNMFSSAGRRIAPQGAFSARSSDEVRRALLRFARGNTLLLNRGDRFDDVSESAGVTMGRWAWSSSFADLNNDGWDDLAIANGYITTGDSSDL